MSTAAEEIGAEDVHLVDISQARNMIVVGLAPDGFRLGLDAALGAEQRDSAIQHAQGTFDFNGEVDMARRVDDVDALAFPLGGCRSGGDRDATLLLLLHPVHGGSAFMDFADFVDLARIEQDPLGRRGLAGVDMGHDADIPRIFQREFSGHRVKLLSRIRLPSVMGERAVGVGHPVHVFFFLEGAAGVVECIDRFRWRDVRAWCVHCAFLRSRPASGDPGSVVRSGRTSIGTW